MICRKWCVHRLIPSCPVLSSDEPTVKAVISVGFSSASNKAKPAASTPVSVWTPLGYASVCSAISSADLKLPTGLDAIVAAAISGPIQHDMQRGWRPKPGICSNIAGPGIDCILCFAMTLRPARNEDFEEIVKVWEASVVATHDFLSLDDIADLREKLRREYLQLVHLMVRTDELGAIQGFVGVAERKIEMLFIAPELRGLGIGRSLLAFAVSEMSATQVDVNEQNPGAIGFYERMGFRICGRSPRDGQGRPFPLLHMELSEGEQ